MLSTLRNIVYEAPSVDGQAVVGRHLTCPDQGKERLGEGGLRLSGKFKRRTQGDGMPLVTVVTVCLNAARTLEQCLSSVFAQTWQNIEYIVIDGGSTDGTLDIIRRHEHALDYWVSEPDGGLYQAMNKGLALAAGDFVLFLNSDDWYTPDCVESLVNAKRYSGADFVSARAQYVDGAGKPVYIMRSMPYDPGIRIRMPLRHETMLIPAAIYNAVGGYDTSYRIIADFHLSIRLFTAGCTHYELPRPLIRFRNTGVSTVNLDGLFAERRRLIRSEFPFLSEAEAYEFGELAHLKPHRVESLVKRYQDQRTFLEAAASYCEDRGRHSPGHPDWLATASRLRALEQRDRPAISIILPVSNHEATLRECIDSIRAQTFTDFELICINDAGTDGSQAIIDSYRSADARVVSLVNKRRIGYGASVDHALRHARGRFIIHAHPCDVMPPAALKALHGAAVRHGSDIVKGAYLCEHVMHGKSARKAALETLRRGDRLAINTNLSKMPELLQSAEGRWPFLYDARLARKVHYHPDLEIEQDNLFLVSALSQAKRVTIIGDVVNRYRVNPTPGKDAFNLKALKDALECRRRTWHILADSGFRSISNRLFHIYWESTFFFDLASAADPGEFSEFMEAFRFTLADIGIKRASPRSTSLMKGLAPLILGGQDEDVRQSLLTQSSAVHVLGPGTTPAKARLRVATFVTRDDGGAGTGSLRRVEALRRRGIDARIFSLIAKSGRAYVSRIKPGLPSIDESRPQAIWNEIRNRAIDRAQRTPGYRASELFSLTDTVLDFRNLVDVFDAHDVIHLHWVVGMMDYEHAGGVLSSKPVVWTLADMNAFTGGCHYSEGCEEYKRECRACPLLGGRSDLAHETWKIKKQAYDRLENLHIICPSPWMAERVRESSLLGARPVHYIPNPFPIETLQLTAKMVARARLGLPLDRKLLLFGSDNLENRRKGGDLLKDALRRFHRKGSDTVELIVFGAGSIETPLPIRSLGYVTDTTRLALAYAAADAYLFPSREDNAPLTVGESLLCGTPVVAFPVGNVPSLVEHRVTGYIARHLDTKDFARGIEWALNASAGDALVRSARCRTTASAYHDPGVSAERHEAVYRLAMDAAT